MCVQLLERTHAQLKVGLLNQLFFKLQSDITTQYQALFSVGQPKHVRAYTPTLVTCINRGATACMHACVCTSASWRTRVVRTRPVSVKNTILLREPWPRDQAAETAIQPQIWWFQSCFSHQLSYPEDCFFNRHR